MRAILTALLLASAGAAVPDARAHGRGRHLGLGQQAAQQAGYGSNAGPGTPQDGGQSAQSPGGGPMESTAGPPPPAPGTFYSTSASYDAREPDWPLPSASSAADSGAPAPPEAPPAPDPPVRMSAEDLRANFATVVQNYVARRGEDGAWTFQEPKGRARRLELVSVEASRLRKAGRDRYAAPVVFRDASTQRRLRLEFTVDLSGSAWAVTAVRSLPEPPGPKTAPR